jgi:hypothetical protein
MWWDSGNDSLKKKIFDSKLAEDDGKSDELRVLKERTVFFPDVDRPVDSKNLRSLKSSFGSTGRFVTTKGFQN